MSKLRFSFRRNSFISVIMFCVFFLEDTKAKNTQQSQTPNLPYIALYGGKDEYHTGIWIPNQSFYICKMQT